MYNDSSLLVNLFYESVERFSKYLMSQPPEIDREDGGDLLVSDRFIEQLLDAMRMAIIDYRRFGTAIFRIGAEVFSETDIDATVECPSPIYWFPASHTDDVLVIPSLQKGVPTQVYLDLGYGYVQKRDFDYSDSKILGRLIDASDPVQIGSDEHWAYLQKTSIGRPGTIVPVLKRSGGTNWGRSLYLDAYNLVCELNRGFERGSIASDKIVQSKIILRGDGDNPTGDLFAPDVDRALAMQEVSKNLTLGEDAAIGELPRGYESAEPLEWMVNVQDLYLHNDKLLEMFFGISNMPAALYGIRIGDFPASGKALIEEYFSTSADVQEIQTQMVRSLKRAILVGAMVNGVSVQELQSLDENLIIEWTNKFDDDTVTEDAEIEEGDDELLQPETDRE